MNLGFSEATFRVVKRGQGVREQGQLCMILGATIAPLVHHLLDDGYEMEMLNQPPARSAKELSRVMYLLQTQVWHRPSRAWTEYGWLDPLMQWSIGSPWLTGAIALMYPTEPREGYSLIHGDPTLANLMMRENEQLVLADPMPRVAYRMEIPNRREVDLGKLVQSAIGWEHMLGVQDAMKDDEWLVLRDLDDSTRPAAILWAAIHLARVARRAPGKGRHRIASWAEAQSQNLAARFLMEF